MAKREIIWTVTAVRQRREIFEYWINRNGSKTYVEKLIKLISKRTKVILNNPYGFKITEYPNTRTSAMGHFSILYKVSDNHIIIVAFWDNRQDPKSLLEIIKH